MKGIVVVNGYYTSESERYRCEKLTEEFSRRGVELTIYKNNRVFEKNILEGVDFCLFFDKDYHLSRLIEKSGVRVFNTTDVLEITDNKTSTFVYLEGQEGITMPATVPAPKKYFYVQDRAFLDAVEEKLGLPVVLKESCGSLGKQVYLARTREELEQVDEATATTDKLFQEYRASSFGQSVRIICVGGKALGAMKLTSEGDFRSNAHLGGVGSVFPMNKEYKNAAEKVAEVLQADYAGIDFFADEPVLIEVNGNAYFKQFEEVTGINVAAKYADHILESLSPREGIR